MAALDRFERPLRNLRLSVTDRCNLRCSYCMPEEEYVWLPRADILAFEELARLTEIFAGLGVEKIRLTGGEPLLRRDLDALVRLLTAVPGLRDLALTTNGILLADQAVALRAAGLTRLTVSLDTLKPERFQRLTRRDEHGRVLAGLAAARAAGFTGTKLNTVVLRGVNDDELVELLGFGREHELEVRFIEYMDVGGATGWNSTAVVPRAEMRARIEAQLGPIEPDPLDDPAAPAERFRLSDGTRFGIIASTSEPFCSACDRARLTADGLFYTCLYAPSGTDLRTPLRGGAPTEELAARILGLWRERTDRGAEERLALAESRRPAEPSRLKADPHLEMHTRGG
jgi:cyclic pyranopterin phosphate synthase